MSFSWVVSMPISIPDKFMVSRQTQFTMTLSMSCFLDNIKRRAVLPNEKHAFFVGWRAGMLHYRTGQWAAHYSGLQKRAGQRIVLFCSPPFTAACPFVQYAGLPFCLLRSPSKIHIFHLDTRPSKPPGPLALQLVLSFFFRLRLTWMQ